MSNIKQIKIISKIYKFFYHAIFTNLNVSTVNLRKYMKEKYVKKIWIKFKAKNMFTNEGKLKPTPHPPFKVKQERIWGAGEGGFPIPGGGGGGFPIPRFQFSSVSSVTLFQRFFSLPGGKDKMTFLSAQIDNMINTQRKRMKGKEGRGPEEMGVGGYLGVGLRCCFYDLLQPLTLLKYNVLIQ